jgi:hypothetical protein
MYIVASVYGLASILIPRAHFKVESVLDAMIKSYKDESHAMIKSYKDESHNKLH